MSQFILKISLNLLSYNFANQSLNRKHGIK